MTKAMIQKIAREAGISITLVSVKQYQGNTYIKPAELPPDVAKRNLDYCREAGWRKNTVEVERINRRYNRQVKRLLAVLASRGKAAGFMGRQMGDGTWEYTSRPRTYTDELVFNNMD
jgi:hypothetical protein